MTAVRIPRDVALVFDLDDTLYKERDYVRSCLDWFAHALSAQGYPTPDGAARLHALFEAGERDPIGVLCTQAGVDAREKAALIEAMRAHAPAIELTPGAAALLSRLRAENLPYSIVTNGRGITQRRKLAALGLEDPLSLSISEETGAPKPERRAFALAARAHGDARYFYIGDNPKHDFAAPNALGWTTVMLRDDGRNIHRQTVDYGPDHAARHVVGDLPAVLDLL